MGFSTLTPDMRRIGPGQWLLLEPLTFSQGFNGGGITVVAPVGFETDFASIPRLLRWLYPADGTYALPAVIHDYLYRRGGCSRFLADALFRDMMASVGVPLLRRMMFYYAVRAFGWMFFKRHGAQAARAKR